MQKVFRKKIMHGVNLTCVAEDKFKTGCLSMTFITQLDRKTAALNAVLPYVLRRGTAKYKNMESIAAVLDGLYGVRIEPAVRKKGELQCLGFYADFPDDVFVPEKGILRKTAKLMGEMIYEPYTVNGRLFSGYVDGERENLITDIKSEINDKRSYSILRLLEKMCGDERYGVSRTGTLAEASKISVATLTKHYKEVIASSELEVFYCGAADLASVEHAVKDALAALPRKALRDAPTTQVVLEPAGSEPVIYTDVMDVTQGKLALGYRMGDIMKSPNYAAMMVFNSVFGGDVTSKLFMNVREKLSLCYFANSSMDKHKGILVVSSGIEFSKYDEAFAEINIQLEAIKNGDFSDNDLESAKRSLITSLSGALDEPLGIEALYLDRTVSGMEITPEELIGLVDAVTKQNVVDVAKGVKLDTVYFLRGEESADEA